MYTMCSALNVYMFVYTLIGAHIVPLIPDTVDSTISPGPLYLQVSHVSLSHESESHKI